MHFLSIRDGILENVLFLPSKILLGRDMKGAGRSSFVLGTFLTREMVT